MVLAGTNGSVRINRCRSRKRRRGRRDGQRTRAKPMVRVPARGLTNVAFPLRVAECELMRVPAGDARVLGLSDCVHHPQFPARCTSDHQESAWPSSSLRPRIPRPRTARR